MSSAMVVSREAGPTARLSDDVGQFSASIAPHVDKMRRVAVRLTGISEGDDVLQDALMQAWRARSQFDPGKGTLASWLLAITAHQATKVRRRMRVVLFPARDDTVGVDDAVDVRAAIARLPKRERLAIDCFYFADLSIADTAAVMGCSEGTVKSTLSSARDHLRGILK